MVMMSYPGQEPNEVVTPVDKHGRTRLNYIPCVVGAFKKIKKGSRYYRRIIAQKKSMGRPT